MSKKKKKNYFYACMDCGERQCQKHGDFFKAASVRCHLCRGPIDPDIRFNRKKDNVAKIMPRFFNSLDKLVYIYVIVGNGFAKIGFSNDPPRRLASLQSASPNDLTMAKVVPVSTNSADARKVELAIHEMFASERVRGEWFKYTDRIKSLDIGNVADVVLQAASA